MAPRFNWLNWKGGEVKTISQPAPVYKGEPVTEMDKRLLPLIENLKKVVDFESTPAEECFGIAWSWGYDRFGRKEVVHIFVDCVEMTQTSDKFRMYWYEEMRRRLYAESVAKRKAEEWVVLHTYEKSQLNLSQSS